MGRINDFFADLKHGDLLVNNGFRAFVQTLVDPEGLNG